MELEFLKCSKYLSNNFRDSKITSKCNHPPGGKCLNCIAVGQQSKQPGQPNQPGQSGQQA